MGALVCGWVYWCVDGRVGCTGVGMGYWSIGGWCNVLISKCWGTGVDAIICGGCFGLWVDALRS